MDEKAKVDPLVITHSQLCEQCDKSTIEAGVS